MNLKPLFRGMFIIAFCLFLTVGCALKKKDSSSSGTSSGSSSSSKGATVFFPNVNL